MVTNSTSDCKALTDVKNKMHVSWDTRISFMVLHYIATFLDASFKNLRSLLDYMKILKDKMSDFILELMTELGITIKHKQPAPFFKIFGAQPSTCRARLAEPNGP